MTSQWECSSNKVTALEKCVFSIKSQVADRCHITIFKYALNVDVSNVFSPIDTNFYAPKLLTRRWHHDDNGRTHTIHSTVNKYYISPYITHIGNDERLFTRECLCDTKPVTQIPQCTSPVSHNAPFCDRNVHMYAHFCYKMVHCGIFVWCTAGFCYGSIDLSAQITTLSTGVIFWLRPRMISARGGISVKGYFLEFASLCVNFTHWRSIAWNWSLIRPCSSVHYMVHKHS